MKRYIIYILTALLALNLCACGSKNDDKNDAAPTQSAADGNNSGDETTPAPEDEPNTPIDTGSSDIVALNGFSRNINLHSVEAISSDKALLFYGALSEEDSPEDRMLGEYITLFDVENDVIVKEAPTQSGCIEDLVTVFEGGGIMTWEPASATLYSYNSDLSPAASLSLPEETADCQVVYDKTRNYYICYKLNTLYEYTSSGSLFGTASFNDNAVITAVDPETGLLVYETSDDNMIYGKTFTLYDTKTSTKLHTDGTAAGDYILHGEKLALASERPIPDSNGETISNHTILSVFDRDYASSSAFDLENRMYVSWDNGTDYAFSVLPGSENGENDNQTVSISFIDPVNGKTAEPALNSKPSGVRACVLPETGKYLVAVLYASGEAVINGMNDASLYLIDPALLSYEDTLASASADSEEVIKEQYDTNNQLLRNVADSIENDYDVKIYFGEACHEVYKPEFESEHKIAATSDINKDASADVSAMLVKIRTGLSVYPENYMGVFKTDSEESGLRILIVDKIDPDKEQAAFRINGFTFKQSDYYNIIIDSHQSGNDNPIFHHEFWHAIEYRILEDDFASFDSAAWYQLNHPEFTKYGYGTEGYQTDESFEKYYYETIVDGGYNKDAYYEREYSTLNDKEDRATLIELLHNGSLGEDCFSSAEAMKEYPHLKAKLDFMADRMRPVFGSVYWEE